MNAEDVAALLEERALADDAAELLTHQTDERVFANPNVQAWLVRYREARQR